MPQAVSRPALTAKAWVRFQTSPREICGWLSDNGTDFSPSTWVFACISISLPMFYTYINPSTSNDRYRGRTAPLTSKRCILYIYSTNIGTEYFKRGIHSPFLSLQNAVRFIILTYLLPVLFTFYIQSVLKLTLWRRNYFLNFSTPCI